MICHEFKTIFIHIPKTAGTSVESMFGKVQIKNQNYFIETNEPGKHWGAEFLQEKYSEYFNEYFKWTIVRNPWEREVSLYNMLKNQVRYRHMDFHTFLNEVTIPAIKENNQAVFSDQINYLSIKLYHF